MHFYGALWYNSVDKKRFFMSARKLFNFMSQEFIEQHKFYLEDTFAYKQGSALVRRVFERLVRDLRDKDGKPINIDEFYFGVVGGNEVNAFCVPEKKLIAVSRELLNFVENEDELAGVIGHETGHWVWMELLGGKNTIFQETSADFYTMKLMQDAGYNPICYRNVLMRLSKDNVIYSMPSLDVHGDIAGRIQNINACLTKIAMDSPLKSVDSVKESKEIKEVAKKIKKCDEDWISYFITRLREKFGIRSCHDLVKNKKLMYDFKSTDLLKFFLDEISGTNINSLYRLKQFWDEMQALSDYMRGSKYVVEPSAQEKDLLQQIFVKFRANPFYSRLGNFGKEDEGIIFIEMFGLKEKFGPFKEQAEYLQQFIDAYDDAEKMQEIAKKCMPLKWTVEYSKPGRTFVWPYYKPFGKENIGKPLPWVTAKRNLEKLNLPGDSAAFWLYYTLVDRGYYQIMYSKPEYSKEKYYIENDIVLAYGEDVKSMVIDAEFKKQKSRIYSHVDILNIFARYKKGVVSKEELNKFVCDFKPGGVLSVINSLFYFSITSEERVLLKESDNLYKLYESLQKEDFFQEFIKSDKVFAAYSKKVDKIKLITSENENQNQDFEKEKILSKICLMLSFDCIRNMQNYILKTFVDEIDSSSFHDIDVIGLYNNIQNGLAKCSVSNRISRVFSINQKDLFGNSYVPYSWMGDLEEELLEKTEKDLSKLRYDIALRFADFRNMVFSINWFNKYIGLDYKKGNTSEIFVKLFNHLGVERPRNGDDIVRILKEIGDKYILRYDDRYSWFVYNMLVDCLLRGCEVNDIFQILRYADKANESDGVAFVISKYIDGFFDSISLQEQIDVYELMIRRKLFSKSDTNKPKFAKIIVRNLIDLYKDGIYSKDEKLDIIKSILLRSKMVISPDRDFEYVSELEKLIEVYASHWANLLGKDDNSPEYVLNLEPVLQLISGDNSSMSDHVAKTFVRIFSDKIVAQKNVANLLNEKTIRKVSGETAEKYDENTRIINAVFALLSQDKKISDASIDFLLHECDDLSVALFNDRLKKRFSEIEKKEVAKRFSLKGDALELDMSMLMMAHENFWALDLPLRAVLMNRLLSGFSSDKDKKIEYVLNKFFDKNSEYYDDALLIMNAMYNNFTDYERDLILAALIASGKRDKNDNANGARTIGQGLKKFFQNKGPAFVKFGQLLSYVPNLDSEIREELATLRDKADLPSRKELFDMMEKTLPESELKKISYVDSVIGGGSFYVTTKIKYDDRNCVVAIMRPNVKERVLSGMEQIEAIVKEVSEKDKKYSPIKKTVLQAKMSAESEINIESDYKKYLEAVDMYERLKVETPTGTYSPDVAKWMAYGRNSEGSAYKIMEQAPGEAMTSDEWTVEEKHDFAMAYVTLELSLLLAGKKWDTDRHQGQQNFYNNAFRDFVIGIFDTGAQMDAAPSTMDKIQLGNLLFDLINIEKNKKNLSDVLLDTKGGGFETKFVLNTTYIDGVKRGLVALSDIIEYQKEIKDENGVIIQESKSLTKEDLTQIANAILASGIVNKTVIMTLGINAILNNMLGGLSKYFGKKSPTNNPVIIHYVKPGVDKKSRHMDKSKEELKKRMEQENRNKEFGIKKGLTHNMNDDVSK